MSTESEKVEEVSGEAILFPEAGGIAWVELHGTKDGNDVKINLTARAVSPLGALEDLLQALKVAQEKYNLLPYMKRSVASLPVVKASASSVVSAPAPVARASDPNEPIYVDDAGTVPTGGVIMAERMAVTPRADGKTKCDFYEAGHKYPDISCVMTKEQLATLLAPVGAWTVEHFAIAGNYEIAYAIAWQNSTRTNQYGKPYKNIVSVTFPKGA